MRVSGASYTQSPATAFNGGGSPVQTSSGGSDSSGGEVPANLRRKVRAPRPSMGHVVPSAGAQRGKTDGPKLRPQGKARDAGLNNPSALKILGGIARGRRCVFSVV